MAGRRCPCGCGKALGKYNGQAMLMCYETWQKVPREVRARVMTPGVMERDRRAAVFQALKHTNEVRKARTQKGRI